jgi:hypothetical protein
MIDTRGKHRLRPITVKPDRIGVEQKGVLKTDLQADVVTVDLHGSRADVKLLRRVVCRVAVRHQDHDFQLAIGELVKARNLFLVTVLPSR